MKVNLNYLDKTDWLFQKNTVNFTQHIPFENQKNELLNPSTVITDFSGLLQSA